MATNGSRVKIFMVKENKNVKKVEKGAFIQ